MAYHDDLIEHAFRLTQINLPNVPNQVDLRRAVSAAYYALFQMLTTEAAQNWKHQSHRIRFARMFDHGRMKACSSKVSAGPLPNDPAEKLVATDLKLVAKLFVKLQLDRHAADYNNSIVWSRTPVQDTIIEAQNAITAWMAIRGKGIAQDYLFDLMGTR